MLLDLSLKTSAALTSATEQAALIGDFNPKALLADHTDVLPLLLGGLAELCVEVELGETIKWRLTPDVRRITLSKLKQDGRLSEVAKIANPAETDIFGKFLTQALQGKSINPNKLSAAALDDLHTAMQFAAPVAAVISPEIVEIELARREVDSAVDMVLPTRLIGRAKELKQLLDFVYPSDPELIDTLQKPLRLSGVGGSGKSALLASFARSQKKPNWKGTPIIWLDFDRALLAARDDITLMLEFTRQLGLYRPELGAQLSAFRREVRKLAGKLSEQNSSESDSSSNATSTMWAIWDSQLSNVLPIKEPVVLILDTYEEVVIRGLYETEYVERWLESLYYDGKFLGLRAILSGRSFPKDPDYTPVQQHEIELGDLSKRAAQSVLSRFLQHEGVDPAAFPVTELVHKLGRNPLVLKILARYLAEVGVSAAQDVLDNNTEVLDGKLAQSFLYTRILKRIRTDDPEVSKLAHPGLILRRITPDIIERVLATPCKLDTINTAGAKALFKKLALQIWLVEKTDIEWVIIHRRDLRRLMLEMMTTTEKEASAAIHSAAMRYYQEHNDPYLSSRLQDIESSYHSLFTSQPHISETKDIAEFIRVIGEDIGNIPLSLRAKIKFAGDRPLSDEEQQSLNEADQQEYGRRTVKSKIKRGINWGSLLPSMTTSNTSGLLDSLGSLDFALGSKMVFTLDSSVDSNNLVDSVQSILPKDIDSFVAVEFANGNLKALAEIASQVVEEFFLRLENREFFEGGDFTESSIWRVALACLLNNRHINFGESIESKVKKHYKSEWNANINSNTRHRFTTASCIAMLLKLCEIELPEVIGFVENTHLSHSIGTVGALRFYQLVECASNFIKPASYPIDISPHILCDLSKPYINFIFNGNADGLFDLNENFPHEFNAMLNSEEKISLSLLQEMRTYRSFISIFDPPFKSVVTRQIIRGLSPELYPLIRGAFQQTDLSNFVEFSIRQTNQADKLWPVELTPKVLEGALARDPSRWISTFLEVVDRRGQLKEFVVFSADRNPKHNVMADIVKLITRYDSLLVPD